MSPKAGRAVGFTARIRNSSSTRYTPRGASLSRISNWAVRSRIARSARLRSVMSSAVSKSRSARRPARDNFRAVKITVRRPRVGTAKVDLERFHLVGAGDESSLQPLEELRNVPLALPETAEQGPLYVVLDN